MLPVADYVFDALKGCDVSKEILMKSIVGFHSYTGCDTISKVKPLKLMLNNTIYEQTFAQLGENTDVSETTLQTIKSFVCHMYGWKGFDSVDEIRYRMYCQWWESTATAMYRCFGITCHEGQLSSTHLERERELGATPK